MKIKPDDKTTAEQTEPEKQRLFSDINTHLLQDEKPSVYLKDAAKDPLFAQYPFTMLLRLKETKQSPKYHPEGSVWNHTVMVTDIAAQTKSQSKTPRAFMWAALLHDIGKPDTTRSRGGRITSYDHDRLGAEMAVSFLQSFTGDKEFVKDVAALIRYHMQILFVVNGLPFAQTEKMKEEVDVKEIALLGFCDRMGRAGADRRKEEENIRLFLEKCRK